MMVRRGAIGQPIITVGNVSDDCGVINRDAPDRQSANMRSGDWGVNRLTATRSRRRRRHVRLRLRLAVKRDYRLEVRLTQFTRDSPKAIS